VVLKEMRILSGKIFLVAILFVLFDVEVIFLYPWAINFKELE
jgi:NADH-quinone oxidoreductase subunit A